ncbi:MAG: nucleotidyltransferase family protein [Syntrophomonadaceae bacterium]|jgi:predicted nucleotidyltransferase
MSRNGSVDNLLEFRAIRKHLIKLDKQDEQYYYQQALQKAKDVAAMLKGRYGVKQVYLYGSLAWGGFDQHSDIDLYLVGFQGNYWRACSEADDIATPIEVSLACEEECIESLKNKVLENGVLL